MSSNSNKNRKTEKEHLQLEFTNNPGKNSGTSIPGSW